MKKNINFLLKGTAIIERRKLDGTVIDREVVNNLIVDTGKERVAKLLCGVVSGEFAFIGVGTGTTSPTASDTTLETQVLREAAILAYEADFKAIFEKTFLFASAYTITEGGIFQSASSGTMLDRFTFTGKEVDDLTTLYIKIIITIS